MSALPIFTASRPATIVSTNELNFCVRVGHEPERCRWQIKRGRSEGSGRQLRLALGADKDAGHRNRKQVDRPPVPIRKNEKSQDFS